ncbi:MAG: cob(I)yrinic acid a,c-diamide adenosyltransferase [Desulfobacteraceae bacterium]|nr:cob(I)yrinic acid a,c-diamide adenosyltransferase [Desulfobacteraceae bacterium]
MNAKENSRKWNFSSNGRTNKMKKGLLMVFTGNGKGKTTSALGLAMRSAGHGLKVCFIQFIKGGWKYGELDAVKRFEDVIDFHVMGKGFTWNSEDFEKDKAAANQGWQLAKKAISSKQYHLVVLDEFTYLLKYKMLELQTVLDILKQKPPNLHVAITGRNAPGQLLAAADLATEMKEIKHPFKIGIKAQKGVEF